jgi:carbamoyltransferase
LRRELAALGKMKENALPPLMFTEASPIPCGFCIFSQPLRKSCCDVSRWRWRMGNQLCMAWRWQHTHSTVGYQLSTLTGITLFRIHLLHRPLKVNSGEYKLMGLAPYGSPKYVDLILDNLIDVKEDGSFRLDMSYFNYATGLTMTNEKFHRLFNGPPRARESDVSQKEMDIARSIQVVTEEIVLKLARTVQKELGVDKLCLAGGVALNCVSNGRLLREGPFSDIWVQPAAGDAGGALGAALAIWYQYLGNTRAVLPGDSMKGSYLGPRFSDDAIKQYLDSVGAKYQRLDDARHCCHNWHRSWPTKTSSAGLPGAWNSARAHWAVASIIGDPRSAKMQSVMNLKIKYRESFRPFAPAIKADKVGEWFQHKAVSPYMLMVAPVAEDKRIPMTEEQQNLFGIAKLNVPRSQIPAVTHVDYSARIQTVHKETNPRFYTLLDEFEKLTGCPVSINTSFNVRGEPIVNTPEDAYRCFMRCEMDYLVLENYLLAKPDQPVWERNDNWQNEFELD